MYSLFSCRSVLNLTFLVGVTVLGIIAATAQTSAAPPIIPPTPLAVAPTAAQQQALQNVTPTQIQLIQSVITPQLQQAIQSHQGSASGSFRSWQDIISNGSSQSDAQASSTSASTSSSVAMSSKKKVTVQFTHNNGTPLSTTGIARVYHPATATVSASTQSAPTRPTCCPPIRPNPDQDGDGLPDNPDLGDLEDPIAQAFMPTYFISAGEQQQFASFGNYVPWTVTNTLGPNPNSYYHVVPLGLATDSSGNQLYAIRVDYLSLWNADGGLVGGGAACFYSYFGLDSVINQVSGHELDAERSVMLLAAPAVDGSFNPDPSAYSLYSIYTAAHEGTFFDQSEYTDFPPLYPLVTTSV